MNLISFDSLTRSLGQRLPRRRTARLLGALIASGPLSWRHLGETQARRKKGKGKRKGKKKRGRRSSACRTCSSCQTCQDNTCVTVADTTPCPGGSCQGGVCIPCGAGGQTCCPGNTCSGGLFCAFKSFGKHCVSACGQYGQGCCVNSPGCTGNLVCCPNGTCRGIIEC